ncbi:MAG: hypothetical protein EOO25_04840 [Comamonadaceae bacterium]|nr:MAG: hypothetical protein EOO25_04840 [Comamonadaceae bacterium]
MNRRNFIRVTGGGSVLAATALSAGCSQQMPGSAIAAWSGPGPEADVRRWLLGYAILALHPHNPQSLRADIGLFPEGAYAPDKPDRRPVARRRVAHRDDHPAHRAGVVQHGVAMQPLQQALQEYP